MYAYALEYVGEHGPGEPLLDAPAHSAASDPDELIRLDPNLGLLLRPGEAPVIGTKLRHCADAEFRELFDPA